MTLPYVKMISSHHVWRAAYHGMPAHRVMNSPQYTNNEQLDLEVAKVSHKITIDYRVKLENQSGVQNASVLYIKEKIRRSV